MRHCELNRLANEDIIRLIGKEWMLVTAGTPGSVNTMTASWGGIGYLWNKPVAFIFVRPERFTHSFIEREDRLTLSFFGDAHRDALTLCGTKSGRDMDKIAASGLTPVTTPAGCVTFAEARLTLECRKLYRTQMRAEDFLDAESLRQWYNDRPGGSLHTIYVAEIESVYEA